MGFDFVHIYNIKIVECYYMFQGTTLFVIWFT